MLHSSLRDGALNWVIMTAAAPSRIDFPAWLDTLRPRDRKIAMKLAVGETTGRVSRQHRLSAGRVSQLRRDLHKAWCRFQGEAEPSEPAATPA